MKRGELPVTEGQKIKMLFLDWDDRTGQVLARLSVYTNDNLEMIIAVSDELKYYQVAKAEIQTKVDNKTSPEDDEEEDTDSIRLYDSFYETALKQEVPKPIINDLVRIFANDVDFQRAATPSDSFEVFYEESEEGDGRVALVAGLVRGERVRGEADRRALALELDGARVLRAHDQLVLAVGQADLGALTLGRVRLLGRADHDLDADAAAERGVVQGRRLRLGLGLDPRLADELVDGRHGPREIGKRGFGHRVESPSCKRKVLGF